MCREIFADILDINAEEGWVRVQPGVIRNELKRALRPHGLLFGPETSTQNRAMMGGMLGNNSCGSNSIKYGIRRRHPQDLEPAQGRTRPDVEHVRR